MSDNNENRPEHNETDRSLWEYGQVPSSLECSKADMSDVRKDMVRFALQHPIRDIRTYSGYKGDLLVEITTADFELLPVLKAYAESIGMQTVVKEKFDIRVHEIYCITPDEEVYGIKE